MANKGYTSQDLVAAYLGSTFTPSQITQCVQIIGQVEAYIDRVTRRNGGWLQTAITSEQYDLNNIGIRLFLRSRPVASVQSILVRTYQVGDPGQTLVAGTDYEFIDPVRGLVILSATYDSEAAYSGYDDYGGSAIYSDAGALLRSGLTYGSLAEVSYTPGTPLPADLTNAATQLAAHWMEYTIYPGRFGVGTTRTEDQSVQLLGGMTRDIPTEVQRIVGNYRRLLL